MIHSCCSAVGCSSPASSGSAMFRMVMSIVITSRLAVNTARAAQRRPFVSVAVRPTGFAFMIFLS